MNFLQMKQEVEARVRSFDLSQSEDETKIVRWINMAQQYICGKKLWPFMIANEIVQTVTDITTGTVSINAADTSLTFSSAPSISVSGRYIQFSTSNDWYEITSHTAASTSATINPSYVGTSNLTSGTYSIRKLLYTTTSPFYQIMNMKQLVTPARLISESPRETDYLLPLFYSTGNPYSYIMSTPNSAGTPQFSFIPSPSSVMNVMVTGVKTLSDLSDDAGTSVIPSQWHDAIVHIACFYAFQSSDNTRATSEFQAGEMRIKDMANALCHDLGRHRIMQPFDRELGNSLQWSLPSNFGPEVG